MTCTHKEPHKRPRLDWCTVRGREVTAQTTCGPQCPHYNAQEADMPRGQYIDWDELRDGVPLWMWARDEHANGKSWGCIERELGCGDGAARKAAARKEAVALLPDPPAELPAPPCDDEPTAFIGNQEPAVPVTEGDQRMAAQLSARQRESEYTAAMAAATDDEPRIALPADVVRAALVAYAWCSQKPRRWSKAHDSRAAVETAQRILDECGEAA